MVISEETKKQLGRLLTKISNHYPLCEEPDAITDIHILVSQDTGEVLVLDDFDTEITQTIVEEWADNDSESFFHDVADVFRALLRKESNLAGTLGILKPYSFLLEDEERDRMEDLYLADDDTVILGGNLMEDLDNELEQMLNDLLSK